MGANAINADADGSIQNGYCSKETRASLPQLRKYKILAEE